MLLKIYRSIKNNVEVPIYEYNWHIQKWCSSNECRVRNWKVQVSASPIFTQCKITYRHHCNYSNKSPSNRLLTSSNDVRYFHFYYCSDTKLRSIINIIIYNFINFLYYYKYLYLFFFFTVLFDFWRYIYI